MEKHQKKNMEKKGAKRKESFDSVGIHWSRPKGSQCLCRMGVDWSTGRLGWNLVLKSENFSWICLRGAPQKKTTIDSPNGGFSIGKIKPITLNKPKF